MSSQVIINNLKKQLGKAETMLKNSKRKQPEPLTHLTLQEKKDRRRKMVYDKLCKQYKVKKLSEMQFRYLEKGIEW